MRVATKGLLVSALILALCDAVYAQGAGSAGTGGAGGTAGGNGAGQGGTGITTPNGSGTTGSTSTTSRPSTTGTSSGGAQPKMNAGRMDAPASASGIKKPY
ncbi:hypothetical protein SBC1_75990 (plasmid) [Caballeronia sp. SBC1]|nr:hypothetical protein SBC2_79170 [Caballeronia sp. SBC2]QIN67552.1 hypothetical protein SBC1_75990 [Caballeronia sp. SBC1]